MNDRDILSQNFQDSIIQLMITDTSFVKVIRAIIKEEYFTSKYSRSLFKLCINFFDFHNESPKNHFSDELKRFFDSQKRMQNTEKKIFIEYAKKLQNLHPPTASYIKTRLNEFIVTKELEIGTLLSAELLEDGKLAEAKETLYTALKSGIETVNKGQYYHDQQDLETRLEQTDVDWLMPFGIPQLDKITGGIYRGRLLTIAGYYGIGKSWWLIHLAKQAMKRGLNVLHISHEMSETELKIRYDQSFGALTQKKEKEILVWYYNKREGKLYKKNIKRPAITNYKVVQRIRKMTAKMPGKLRIKKFPMSSATMIDIRNLLDQLESFDNFMPDLILNDYPDIMADGGDYEMVNENYKRHKRIADERGVAIIIPSQINDEIASKTCRIGLRHLSINKQKAGHADSIITLSQTDEMFEHDQLCIQIIKARNSAIVGAKCIVGTNFATGQFRKYSIPYSASGELFDIDGDDEDYG